MLLKCRDAIEALNVQLEEERQEKQGMAEEMMDMRRLIEDMNAQD